jgi:hypothetical protein
VESAGDFVRYRNASPRKCEHQQVVLVGIIRKLDGQAPAGVSTVEENRWRRNYSWVAENQNSSREPASVGRDEVLLADSFQRTLICNGLISQPPYEVR